jgi:hypothetical protein
MVAAFGSKKAGINGGEVRKDYRGGGKLNPFNGKVIPPGGSPVSFRGGE